MNTLLCLRTAGVLLLSLSVLNLFVPRRFKWREELAKVSLLNRQIFQVHSLFITLSVVMMGILSLVFPRTLVEPSLLAVLVLSGLAIFWSVRLFAQWCIYDRRLWLGKRFETTVHFIFTGFWIYLVAVYGWALAAQLNHGAALTALR